MINKKLIRDLADELRILHAAWVIVADDDRYAKELTVSPRVARRWKALVRRADSVLLAAAPGHGGETR